MREADWQERPIRCPECGRRGNRPVPSPRYTGQVGPCKGCGITLKWPAASYDAQARQEQIEKFGACFIGDPLTADGTCSVDPTHPTPPIEPDARTEEKPA